MPDQDYISSDEDEAAAVGRELEQLIIGEELVCQSPSKRGSIEYLVDGMRAGTSSC